jgi:hypothetical protein
MEVSSEGDAEVFSRTLSQICTSSLHPLDSSSSRMLSSNFSNHLRSSSRVIDRSTANFAENAALFYAPVRVDDLGAVRVVVETPVHPANLFAVVSHVMTKARVGCTVKLLRWGAFEFV